MIKINCADIEELAKEYKKHLFHWFQYGEKRDNLKNKVAEGKPKYNRMLEFVYQRLEKLVLCKPNEFPLYISAFIQEMGLENEYFTNNKYEEDQEFQTFKAIMGSYYKRFFKSTILNDPNMTQGHWLAKKLGVKVCPYCNRAYTFTIRVGDVSTRPQFDHFKPKSKYPFFALSFYNLVPSCPVCNMMKGEEEMETNPHDIGLNTKEVFQIRSDGNHQPAEWITNKEKISIHVTHNCNNLTQLGIEELYKGHIDYIEEIVDKAQAYNKNYYETLITDFQGIAKQPEEIDRFIWGTYIQTAFHGNRPLSKLTYDILKQLKVIQK